MKKKIIVLLKWAIVIGAIVYLIATDKLSWSDWVFKSSAWLYLFFANLSLILCLALGFYRYKKLLLAAGIVLPKGEAWRIGMLSSFFSTFTVGNLGGDVARYFLTNKFSEKPLSTIIAIMMDRLSGVIAIFAIGAVALLFYSYTAEAGLPHPFYWPALICIAIVSVGTGFVAGFILSALKHWLLWLLFFSITVCLLIAICWIIVIPANNLATAEWLLLGFGSIIPMTVITCMFARVYKKNELVMSDKLNKYTVGTKFLNLFAALFLYREKKKCLLETIIISLISQALAVLSIYYFAQCLALAYNPGLEEVFIVSPITSLTNFLPLPVGGVGVGELVFDSLLSLFTSPEGNVIHGGASIYLLYRFFLTAIRGSGGLYLLKKNNSKHMP